MHAAIAVPGSASTILIHLFGRGLTSMRPSNRPVKIQFGSMTCVMSGEFFSSTWTNQFDGG